MVAKRRELWSTMEQPLLAHLAILRELRTRAGETNVVTQGFYTDGYQHCFMIINADGLVEVSAIYNVADPAGAKTIFNFIVTSLEFAIEGAPIITPTVTPTKAAEQRDSEISNFTGDVWTTIPEVYLADGEEFEFQEMPPL